MHETLSVRCSRGAALPLLSVRIFSLGVSVVGKLFQDSLLLPPYSLFCFLFAPVPSSALSPYSSMSLSPVSCRTFSQTTYRRTLSQTNDRARRERWFLRRDGISWLKFKKKGMYLCRFLSVKANNNSIVARRKLFLKNTLWWMSFWIHYYFFMPWICPYR